MNAKFKIQVQHGLSEDQASELRSLVYLLVDARISESWTGSGDPLDAPVVAAEANLARAKFESFVNHLVREGK